MPDDERTIEHKAMASISSGTSKIIDIWARRFQREMMKSATGTGPELKDFIAKGLDSIFEEIRVTMSRKTHEFESMLKQAAISAHAERALQENLKEIKF